MCVQISNNLQDQSTDVPTQARLQASFREYPFTETLRYIQGRVEASLFRNSSDDYEGLMTLIGSKLRKKNRSEMRTMIIGLREYKSDGVHVVRGESIAKSQDSYAEIDTAGLGRYATTLKEHGEKHGAIVRCIARPLSTYPPRYEATLMYQGTMVKAEAKSQREARQKAAMKACDKLDITVK